MIYLSIAAAVRPAGYCARRVVIDTSSRTNTHWNHLADAFAKDVFGTNDTHHVTIKLATLAHLNTTVS